MSVMCIELKPGANIQVNTEPKPDGPPEGFIDSTVKVYRMIDGVKTLIRTEEAFPEGWDKHDFRIANKIASEERRGREMPKKIESPANIEQLWVEADYKVNRLAKNNEVAWTTAYTWLKDAGLVEDDSKAKAEQPPEQEQEQEQEITVKDVLLYELEQADEFCDKCGFYRPQCECEDDFTIEDDKPIPYTVVPQFDLAPVKIQLIAATLAEYREGAVPAEIALELVKRIGGL